MLKKSASSVLTSLRDSTCRSVRLASSLPAALMDSPFKHPETTLTSAPSRRLYGCLCINRVFQQPTKHGYLVYLVGLVCLVPLRMPQEPYPTS